MSDLRSQITEWVIDPVVACADEMPCTKCVSIAVDEIEKIVQAAVAQALNDARCICEVMDAITMRGRYPMIPACDPNCPQHGKETRP